MVGGCCHQVRFVAVHIIWGRGRGLRLQNRHGECSDILGFVLAQTAENGQHPLRFLVRIVLV